MAANWLLNCKGKLRQFVRYGCQCFGLASLLAAQKDSRRSPRIPTFDVVNSLFHAALLRIPSLNALEGDLKESDFHQGNPAHGKQTGFDCPGLGRAAQDLPGE